MNQFVYAVRFERETPAPFLISAGDLIEAANVLTKMSTTYGRAISVQEVGPVIIANPNQLTAVQ